MGSQSSHPIQSNPWMDPIHVQPWRDTREFKSTDVAQRQKTM